MFCVADAEAELAILIFAEDGAMLLPGLPPSDLARADATRAALDAALGRLLGRTQSSSPHVGGGAGPWSTGHHRRKTLAERDAWQAQVPTLGPSIEMCVKSYTITTPTGPQRRFRICNSILT
jgi:hypothetical protein